MAKAIKRICPACGKKKVFRSDQKTCGCKGSHPYTGVRKTEPVDEGAQITFLRKEVQRLQTQANRAFEVEGFRQELLDTVKDAADALEPLPPLPYKTSAPVDTEMAAVIKFSDWHIGEVVLAEETEGFGLFNYEIAKQRVAYITSKIIGWVKTHRQSFRIPRLYVFAEGDFISGDIHRELAVTNEFPVPVQAVNAGALLAQSVATLAPHFPELHLVEVGADNHSRLQPKPQFKQKSQNSMSYVVHAMANALLREHGNINIVQAAGIKELVSVNGVNVLSEHGDTVKAWMGIPYYGMERSRGREANKRMQAMLDSERFEELMRFKKEVGFDFISCGHWHVPGVVSGNILTNGSLNGTTEFDHGCGRHAEPSQVSYMMHPKYKLFDWTPWTAPWRTE